jgi:hypothetical protein
MYARVVVGGRDTQIGEVIRLATALNYSERMKRARVPDKVRRKILRRFSLFPWFMRKEMQQLIEDMSRRWAA